jgi:amino acid transporter
VLTAILAAFFDYRQLVGMSNITIVVQYVFTCLAVPVLRKRDPTPSKAWMIPGGPVIPLIGAVGSMAFLAGANREEVGFAVATLVLGLIVAKGTSWSASRAKARA